MLGTELCVTRGRSHVFMETYRLAKREKRKLAFFSERATAISRRCRDMHMRSQLRRSTRHFLEFKESDGEGQNQNSCACVFGLKRRVLQC